MTRENLSVGRLLNTQITPRMSKIEFDNADYIESCMVFKNFTSLDGGRSREFVAKFNHPDEAKDFIKNYNQIFNDHEAELKAKDEEIERLKGKTQILEVLVDNTKDIIEVQTRMCRTKARSIVAMLFWEWRKSEARIYATNIKWKTGRAFQSQILFEAAYKILKEQQ